MARFVVVVSLVLVGHIGIVQGQISTVSDPQALNLAAQSIAALSKETTVADVKLTASVTSNVGSEYLAGTATLQARGTVESRIDLNLSGTTYSEGRSTSAEIPQGQVTDADGKRNSIVLHNCWTDAAWFFPLLSSLSQGLNANIAFSYVGSEQHNGLSVFHLRTNQIPLKTRSEIPHQTLTDFYLDPTSLLPLAIAFNVHPDNDGNTDIPTEIRFAKYQLVDGVQIPFHIQRLINGGVDLDIVVSSAAVNSGLLDSSFSIQ